MLGDNILKLFHDMLKIWLIRLQFEKQSVNTTPTQSIASLFALKPARHR